MIKQWIIIRKDLNMRKGKIAAQAAHASMKVFLDNVEEWLSDGFTVRGLDRDALEWARGQFTKICLYVESEQELRDVYERALEQGLPCSLIEDSGLTEFDGVPTLTCVAIGPTTKEKAAPITRPLKLF